MLDFLYGAAQGVAGNFITRLIDALWPNLPDQQLPEYSEQIHREQVAPAEARRLFQTFHIKSGLEAVLNATIDPVVHIVLEDQPTTFYHLAVLVVESRVTGEWYVSSKGELSFEGSGGGILVAEKVASMCANRRIPMAGWVCSRGHSDSLAQGEVLWPQVRPELIPLVAYAGNETFVKYIVSRFKEVAA
ncbi:hypothetical protein [Roseateles koreensis]|uniref:Uncharacterized protein n=1 Tax=Roseateles koreensis TaxID=2987526 RepID=A0ABT5KXR1_9BURK|nr:hypothetical protein [Roseateles koreensis]MDC8787210.1 hypothetical protein [Roseateles koreensis]